MAYINEEPLEEEQSETGGPLIPGGGASNAQAASAPSSPGAGPRKKTPGKFADLGEYLRVNEPQEFGSKVAGKIGDDITAGQGALDTAETEFKSRADANTVRDTGNLTQQLGTDPLNVNKDEFAKIRDAQYKGPTSFADAQDLYGQTQGTAQGAIGKAQASKTEGGRFGLLDTYFGKPQYSQGQKSLDNLLVQNDKNANQAFDQMRQNAAQLQTNVNTTGEQLGAYGSQARGTTDATRNNARTALGIDDTGNATGSGALGSANTAVQEQHASRRAQQNADRETLMNAFQSGDFRNLPPELRQLLGMDNMTSLYGADPNSYLSSTDFTEQQAATPEQAARLRALQELGGLDSSAWSGEDIGAYDTESSLGFNQQGFGSAVGNRQQQYQQAMSAPGGWTAAPIDISGGTGGEVTGAGYTQAALNNFMQQPHNTTEIINKLEEFKAQAPASHKQRFQEEIDRQKQKVSALNQEYGQTGQFLW